MSAAQEMSRGASTGQQPASTRLMSSRPKTRQDLLDKSSLKTLQFSLEALGKAAFHPYVIYKFKGCAKPILISTGVVYLTGLVLTLPIEAFAYLLQILSLGNVSHETIAGVSRSWLRETVSLVPFLALFLLRNLMRKPLYKCFIHLLREVNPGTAAIIEQQPAAQKSERQRRRMTRTIQKVAMLIALELILHVARKSPWLGRPAVVITHFLTMKQALGRDRAIVLSLFGLVPYVEPRLLRFVQLWRSSTVLGQEIIADFTGACIPASDRIRFFKSHDVDIPLFALPGAFLLQIPIVGPLFFVWVQASAAFLVDKFARDMEKAGLSVNGGRSEAKGKPTVEMQPTGPSPTLPSSPAPIIKPSKAA